MTKKPSGAMKKLVQAEKYNKERNKQKQRK